ncbi:MAG TPA: hypothetical protein VFH50_03340, partial [Acidimicrobiales bacterium]|nr:hypothetical protein [Acidimicrobiales bacterium]
MTPFQQVRLWARRAPWPERIAALVGAALVVTVVSWLLVPGGQSGTNVAAGGALGGIGSGSQANTPGSGGGVGASAGASSSALAGSGGAAGPGATGGVSAGGAAGSGSVASG